MTPSRPAPVLLFVYKRPQHARRTVEALRMNELAAESDLIVYSDGPRSEADRAAVEAVRDDVRALSGFASVTLIERERNLGLAGSIISGVTEAVARHGRVIVLEDDMVTSPYFLRYMNDALALYENEERVACIHAFVYPVAETLPDTFFLRGADCWGWATWKRGWELFEPDGRKLLAALDARKLRKRFDLDGGYPYARMLEDQIAGKNDSWAVRWYASAFLADKLCLHPARSLVSNIGLDGSGTHCGPSELHDAGMARGPIPVRTIPVREEPSALRAIERYLMSPPPGRLDRVLARVNRLLGRAAEMARPDPPPVFAGNFASWEDARRVSTGYDADTIVEKVRNALLEVKSGRAAYERDSVLFPEPQYRWPLLAGLLWIASVKGNRLDLVDFGGSLGTSYFQNRRFLEHLDALRWRIVEQEKYVAAGKRDFEEGPLSFHRDIDECLAESRPDAILLSGVLSYLEEPWSLLDKVLAAGADFVIVDRTPFVDKGGDRLTVQRVPPHIFDASYPCWFLDPGRFLAVFSRAYDLVAEFDGFDRAGIDGVSFRGFLFRRRPG